MKQEVRVIRKPGNKPILHEAVDLGFRSVPATGVIWASNEAARLGWSVGSSGWCNLGQGQAETGPLRGSPPRAESLSIESIDHSYAPILGLQELREEVAGFYNQLFRKGLPSQYTVDNVAIGGGGRAALTRVVACLGQINLGHFLPDYTAYEELIESFWPVRPIPILLSRDNSFHFGIKELCREVTGRGLGAVLLSNPSNPTGRLVSGQELRAWIEASDEVGFTLLIDEFYSHYIWNDAGDETENIVSAARWVEDVNRDPVVILDGLSKNWRYPGWRISWTLGPRRVVESIGNAGSFLDGGASRPLQRAAIDLLDIASTIKETAAIQGEFRRKRQLMLRRCRELGLLVNSPPDGGFYIFASLRNLDSPLSDGVSFFEAALRHKVITVPGIFFDVNPGHRRPQRHSRFGQDVRLSFGPPMDVVAEGMDRLATVIRGGGT